MKKETIFKLEPHPTEKQKIAWRYAFDNVTTELGYGGAARGGKSWFGNDFLVWECLNYPDTRWLLGRRELKTLKRTSLQTLFKVFKNYGIKHKTHFEYNQQDSLITFWTDSQILLYDLAARPTDPLFLELGGLELTGALVEESNEVSVQAINILKTRLGVWNNDKYSLKPLLIETFNPDKGHVYHRYYKPSKDGTMPIYRQFVKALPTDNPYTNPVYIEELKRADKITRERLLYGNFEYEDDPTALMDIDALGDLFSNSVTKSEDKYMTVDVARLGMDKTVIMLWKGLKCYRIETIAKDTLDHQVQRLEAIRGQEQIPLSHCIADEDGVGGGVVDFWHCKGFVGGSSAFQDPNRNPDIEGTLNYLNLRAQCYYELARVVNTFGMSVEVDSEATKQLIIEDCEQIRAKDADKDGKIKVVSKDDIKEKLGRSPDFADCMMMRMYFEVANIPEPKLTWLE